jgi:UDP-N-acetyl-2-amino-2-deoxyglucuronate dehydrogenase
MDQTGFGIIGTGMISAFHAQALQAIAGARLVACYDISGERAKAFADTWGCAAHTNLDDFLASSDLNTVIICTPSGLHLEPGLAALDAGHHLVVEKPLEVTADRCDRLIRRASERKRILAGIFPSRFSDAAVQVKAAVDAGRFGTLSLASASVKWYRSQEYYDQAGWRGTWKIDGGGALMNQSIHAIDLLQWFVGDVAETFAYAGTLAHTEIEVEDVASAAMRFENGALGSIMGTTASWPGWAKRIEISGTAGSVVLEDEVIRKWDFAEEQDGDMATRRAAAAGPDSAKGAADPSAIDSEGHRRQLADFLGALGSGGRPLVDGIEARKAVAIIDAIYRSAKSGAPETVR